MYPVTKRQFVFVFHHIFCVYFTYFWILPISFVPLNQHEINFKLKKGEKMKNSGKQIQVILFMILILSVGFLKAQTEYTIRGQLSDENEQPVMFANVALLSCNDSSIIAGTISGNTGKFELRYNKSGCYILSISFIGYKPYRKMLELSDSKQVDLKTITLSSSQTELNEVTITRERLKAKQQVDKTTYYLNTAMLSTSNTATDIIQNVPGVQVDLLQNISLNGSGNILILVNGIERDAAYLAQIKPDRIDRIEIKNSPGAEYDAEITGVINVVLKENEYSGLSGYVYINIPTAKNEVFSFPTASLNYTFDKLTLYTSYNGEFSYFDIKTEDNRQFLQADNSVEILKRENLYQQNWSHKLHCGADYFYNQSNHLSVYAFVSRFSNEQSGSFFINNINNKSENQLNHYKKDEHDLNTSVYTSLFYKHIFTERTALNFETGYYILKSENRLVLCDINMETEQLSQTQPQNSLLKACLNFYFPLNKYTRIKTGFEQNLNYLSDKSMQDFNLTEISSATFLSASYTKKNLQANAGIRAEYLQYNSNMADYKQLALLPSLHIKYSFTADKHLRFSYKQGVLRPSVFQLNPSVQTIDLYATKTGNQNLVPASNHRFNIDYSMPWKNSFLKAGVFYSCTKDVIEALTSLNDASILKNEIHNSGNINRIGIYTSGNLKLSENISINTYNRTYYVRTHGNGFAENLGIKDKHAVNFESSLSLLFLMKHDLAFSFSLQYKSKQTGIQSDYHEDGLYFVSIEKAFFDCIKAGITSAIPFKRAFTYQGCNISGMKFNQSTNDNIQMSMFPVWFKLSYTFSSGKKINRIKGKMLKISIK